MAAVILDTPPTRSSRRPLPKPKLSLGPLPPGAFAIAALAEASCRWPVGEVAEEGFGFCGAPRFRGSYCPVHRVRAYAGIGR